VREGALLGSKKTVDAGQRSTNVGETTRPTDALWGSQKHLSEKRKKKPLKARRKSTGGKRRARFSEMRNFRIPWEKQGKSSTGGSEHGEGKKVSRILDHRRKKILTLSPWGIKEEFNYGLRKEKGKSGIYSVLCRSLNQKYRTGRGKEEKRLLACKKINSVVRGAGNLK